MDFDFWQKQTAAAPLFPDMLWNRPENRLHAGKLLIISGSSSGFVTAAEAYTGATSAGIGSVRVILPDSLARMVSRLFPESIFAASTPSGSFAREALAIFVSEAAWADGVLFPGNLSRNSETGIVLESFLDRHTGNITLAGDALEYILDLPQLFSRPATTLVCNLQQLQKLASALKMPKAITSTMHLLALVEQLHVVSLHLPATIVLWREDTTYVTAQGRVSTSPTSKSITETASSAAVWGIQNPTKPFEATTTALLP